MKQPQLGQKLLDLRKAQGMTQQQLREASHVSVRTIQRIESGAVTPRASTVKIMLKALGEDPDVWFDSSAQSSYFSIHSIKNMLLINSSEMDHKNALAPAWVAGIVYMILIILEIAMSVFLEEEVATSSFLTSYVGLKVMIIIAYFLFLRGFLALSILFENHLLRIASYISMGVLSLNYIIEIVMLLTNPDLLEVADVMNAFFVIPYGAISIILGLGLLRLQDSMGRAAKIAGRLELVMGVSFVTLIFAFVGLVLLAPVLIVEIVLLSKADQLFKGNEI
ncbi:MAG: helix-turn-helix domain-containing protein [Ekhidna sp.]|nr:helix-turn-helix domain-containing protein [Ekhidna sp.]